MVGPYEVQARGILSLSGVTPSYRCCKMESPSMQPEIDLDWSV